MTQSHQSECLHNEQSLFFLNAALHHGAADTLAQFFEDVDTDISSTGSPPPLAVANPDSRPSGSPENPITIVDDTEDQFIEVSETAIQTSPTSSQSSTHGHGCRYYGLRLSAASILTRSASARIWEKIDTWATGILAHQLLTGQVPFYLEAFSNFKAFVESVKEGKIHFDSDLWDGVTEDAKDFVANLVNVDVRKRLSASDALSHPWMTRPSPADGLILRGVRENFDPRLSWRCAINGAVAAEDFGMGHILIQTLGA
ncbi:hypothetical protein EW145_g8099 [Phellinidium pouzarii]|uniref:Protein kinase domain-containing protein n=1 Tax=Phellinidium pouzarii TaxID=167371 RepID=A0A4S4K9W1_9AGAM|nr:hypothetical protein EW145_g8099 [Phellinidium pouzarii]